MTAIKGVGVNFWENAVLTWLEPLDHFSPAILPPPLIFERQCI